MIEKEIVLKFSYCPDGITWFKIHNQWQNRNYIPNAGDIIFFDWENDGMLDHVGIVERIENDYVYTIESNSDDEYRKTTYPANCEFIAGYEVIES